ncbi:MAG: purine-nucleoside phosphorylase [Verrucomicrobiae bacterium]|nr:purine-nucleoside phosphorylase [Verrucomicrobiae bacterium]
MASPKPATTAAFLRRTVPSPPRLAIQLGTGFGGIARQVTVSQEWSYRRVPGFPVGGVPGHEGRLIAGRLAEVPVWVLSGRTHYYEGAPMNQITFPIRVLAALDVETVLLTNASGGIGRQLRPGDFMILRDHINFMGSNPLRGPTPSGLPQFVDCHAVYDATLRTMLRRAARQAGVRCREGVYLSVSGPSFETPAEVRAFARLGADAVGMSTVPEALVARQHGQRVAAVSLVANPASGLDTTQPMLAHHDVLTLAAARELEATSLITGFVRLWAAAASHGRFPASDGRAAASR